MALNQQLLLRVPRGVYALREKGVKGGQKVKLAVIVEAVGRQEMQKKMMTREILVGRHKKRGNCLKRARKKREAQPPRVGPPLACPQPLVAHSCASNTCVCFGRDRGKSSPVRNRKFFAACDDNSLYLLTTLIE